MRQRFSGRRLLLRLAISVVLPAVLYALLRPITGSDVVALAIGGAIPLAVTLFVAITRHRLDRLAAWSLAGFGVGVAVAIASGGNQLLLEVRDAPLTGGLGLILLASAAVGRPLLPELLRLIGRAPGASTPRTAGLPTAIVGLSLVADATARVALAAELPPGSYLVAGRIVGWGILGLGLVALIALRRRGTALALAERPDPSGGEAPARQDR